jgi:acyl-CoA reductase-like NAD-dependent aldehyde dehydrogenase
VSQSRGAAAPTSGNQDHVELDESALDSAVADVAAKASEWAATTPRERAGLLEQIVADTLNVAEEWTAAACAAKGLDPTGPEGG